MKMIVASLIAFFLNSALAIATSDKAHISLDDCDLLIPEGYFVNSGSIRDAGITLISTGVGKRYGSIGIRHGVSPIFNDYENQGFRAQVVFEEESKHFRYYKIAIKVPSSENFVEAIRVETDSYSLSISGHAMSIWEDHLVCPALTFSREVQE